MRENKRELETAMQNNDGTTYINQLKVFGVTATAFERFLGEYREKHSNFTSLAENFYPNDPVKQSRMAARIESLYQKRLHGANSPSTSTP